MLRRPRRAHDWVLTASRLCPLPTRDADAGTDARRSSSGLRQPHGGARMNDKPDAAEARRGAVTDTALVLAGGGVLGIAWQLGLIAALRDEHIDLRAAGCSKSRPTGRCMSLRVPGDGGRAEPGPL